MASINPVSQVAQQILLGGAVKQIMPLNTPPLSCSVKSIQM